MWEYAVLLIKFYFSAIILYYIVLELIIWFTIQIYN